MPEALAASRGEAATDAEKLARVRLIHSENVGPVTFRKLLAGYGSAIRALAALPDLARRGGGRTPRIAPAGDAEREIAAVARFGAVHLHIGLRPIRRCSPRSRTRRSSSR
jgi:DNA processing protein